MGAKVSRNDFHWVGSDEPHATRRKLILEKHPEIKQLMGHDPRFKWIVIAMVTVQLVSFVLLSNVTNIWLLFLTGYCFTGIINHSLLLAIHEIAHGHAFGHSRPTANKLFGMFANLPFGLPVSISFKRYHLEHHRYQGDDILDADIPSRFEAEFFTTTFRKVFWIILQPFFYAFRPLIVHPKKPTQFELLNTAVQVGFDVLVGHTLGWHLIPYMTLSTFVAMGLHPVAGHFVSEHYIMFKDEIAKGKIKDGVHVSNGKYLVPETCSYYGPLNWIAFNVGYHVEHHDFPSVPGLRLPMVKKLAPEFYNDLHYHSSWTMSIVRYIMDPDIGPYARVKRPHRFAGKAFTEDKEGIICPVNDRKESTHSGNCNGLETTKIAAKLN